MANSNHAPSDNEFDEKFQILLSESEKTRNELKEATLTFTRVASEMMTHMDRLTERIGDFIELQRNSVPIRLVLILFLLVFGLVFGIQAVPHVLKSFIGII